VKYRSHYALSLESSRGDGGSVAVYMEAARRSDRPRPVRRPYGRRSSRSFIGHVNLVVRRGDL